MLSEPEPAEVNRVTIMMRTLLVSNALHHWKNVEFEPPDIFGALLLERLGLVDKSGATAPPPDIVAVVTKPDHEKRVSTRPGPMIFVKNESPHISAFHPLDLLASDQPDLRLAAAQFFDELPEEALSKRSRRALNEAYQEIASSDASRWIPAGQRVTELLRNDIYLVLAGFDQCYGLGYDRGVQEYLSRVLRPDSMLLASIDLDAWDPVTDTAVVQKLVARAAEAESLDLAMDEYYRNFGHLPLTGTVGAATVVKLWSKGRTDLEVWSALWAWADKRLSPIARFHACVACLANPAVVPTGLESLLWGEVAEVAGSASSVAQETRWSEPWQIRERLAQHLGNHLSCLTPGFTSERVYGIAWWLTERICSLLPMSHSLLKEFRETTIASEDRQSRYVESLTRPPIGRSGLRYLTHVANRVWSTAIVCELSSALWLLDRCQPLASDLMQIEDAAARTLSQSYPPPSENPKAIFGFDKGIEPLIVAWTSTQSTLLEEKRIALSELLKVGHALSASDGLRAIVEGLAQDQGEAHLQFAHALRMRAYTVSNTGSELKKLLFEANRWQTLLSNHTREVLSHIFEAMAETAVQDGEPWCSEVPHMFAFAAEQAVNPDQQQTLFTLTLCACVNTNKVGALDRLMHGVKRSEFIKFAEDWHTQLLAISPNTTPWASGRLRSVLSNLIVDEIPAIEDV